MKSLPRLPATLQAHVFSHAGHDNLPRLVVARYRASHYGASHVGPAQFAERPTPGERTL